MDRMERKKLLILAFDKTVRLITLKTVVLSLPTEEVQHRQKVLRLIPLMSNKPNPKGLQLGDEKE